MDTQFSTSAYDKLKIMRSGKTIIIVTDVSQKQIEQIINALSGTSDCIPQ